MLHLLIDTCMICKPSICYDRKRVGMLVEKYECLYEITGLWLPAKIPPESFILNSHLLQWTN